MMFFKNSWSRNLILVVFFFALTVQAETNVEQNNPYKIINTEALKEMVNDKSETFIIIDARNPEEYEDVHIPGAINVPEKKFDNYVHLLPKNKGIKLVFYCNGVKCGKSKKAAKKSSALGYINLFVYEEGMPVWEEVGFPVITGPNYEAKIETTKISPLELNTLLVSEKNDFTIVDVRDESEYNDGHIPEAINIPVKSFALRSGELDKKKTIIVYCNAGNRSYKAYRKLMKLAYKKYYQALFADWKAAEYQIEK
jgi:rhodanese-related sulfurtransferase